MLFSLPQKEHGIVFLVVDKPHTVRQRLALSPYLYVQRRKGVQFGASVTFSGTV